MSLQLDVGLLYPPMRLPLPETLVTLAVQFRQLRPGNAVNLIAIDVLQHATEVWNQINKSILPNFSCSMLDSVPQLQLQVFPKAL